ncbi:MAG: Pyridoxal 5'-phosphate synthase (glutamine hydrolyzing), glutaminase subunit [uncultured Friedmanniella sp.]|uniref:Pyridoxal 5'-phosphate synthase subunit PdxT n=1 Tax=uncultured Friedmanniella sp. TaxID=335381 RepID=A0A6J4L2C6_9ACTN|nr:MAG: Pyridoxal 5'-phosphate synthase (glutamine hydrolyzing), glutaminase subunit [uncultured Friedmanniella sp.]
MSRPLIGVLALQGDVAEHERALVACGATTRRVRRAEDLPGLDGLVLPGGESTAIDTLARVTGLREPLRAALADGLPAYGSCAGMILLASELLDGQVGQETFGGLDVAVRRNAFGRQIESFEAELDVSGVEGGPVHAVFIRAPWVERAGPAVEVLASVTVPAEGGERAVAVRQGGLLATSFHPEATGDRRLHAYFLAHCLAD